MIRRYCKYVKKIMPMETKLDDNRIYKGEEKDEKLKEIIKQMVET